MKSKTTAIKHPGLEQLEKVSRLMDSQFKVPGTDIRFGLDPIVGFIPFVGEFATFIVSMFLMMTMARYGGSGKLTIMMMGNIIIDGVVGAVPFLGRFFDFFYKANDRNVRLLADHYRTGKNSGSGVWILAAGFIAAAAIIFGIAWLASEIFQGILGLF